MDKYKINIIYNAEGIPLNEIISEFLVNFLDNEFNSAKLENIC